VNGRFLLNEGRLRPADAAAALILVGRERRYCCSCGTRSPGFSFLAIGVFLVVPRMPVNRRKRACSASLPVNELRYFTEFEFDFAFCGLGRFKRRFYELSIPEGSLSGLVLGEGTEMRAFTADELFDGRRLVPFDAFAIWLHASRDKSLKA
jgi:hypothetical protein